MDRVLPSWVLDADAAASRGSEPDTIGGNQLWWHGGIPDGRDVSKFCEESGDFQLRGGFHVN